MDISETSDTSSHEISTSSQILKLADVTDHNNLDNAILDNIKYGDATVASNKNVSSTQNATNSHPLMYAGTSPISADFPDLIPEKPKSKHTNYDKQSFIPQAHNTALENPSDYNAFEKQFHFDLQVSKEYSELPEVSHAELSDTENDKSVYEAHLSSNLQNVSLTMNEKEGNLNFLAHKKRSNKLRRVKVMQTEASEESDISSLDSISESLKSEHVFTGQLEMSCEDQDDDNSPEPIEPLSAADERRHARHWQRMVLPGGEQRTIDMRVIEPYKRVLSHGGYLRAGGHTAIVIFSACFLPDRSRVDYVYVMDNLFLYILWTLERLVTDDYVLVYLHGGATKLPAFSWLKKCYQMVGRKLRKNLSHLYLVHPTLWIKTMLFMAKPFISSKFYRKITYIATLKELMVRVPLEAAAIPDKVKAYDSLHCVT
ncbi:prune -like 2 [Asbolus verrucosus]|uniref:Prune-like 2 n=1 Tax=Asbolus verrucosus TaxID=1661398 RepID=A0A482VWB5_ASBVE|nr:prune -like 2 [Asbolus verrucosus]